MTQLLERLTLFLKLRDNGLKSFKHKLGFISRLGRARLNRNLLRLTYQLAVRTEHPAEKEEYADQCAQQNGNKGRKQEWASGGGRRRQDRVKQNSNQRGQQEKSC